MLIKFFALYIVARVRHVSSKDATLMSLILAQGGEFGLLILQTMKANDIKAIPYEHQEILTAIIVLSIMLTPILLFVHDWLLKRGLIFAGKSDKKLSESMTQDAPVVIISGFGRMGQIIAQMLETSKIPYIAIDSNVDGVIMARESGYNVIYGDSRKKSILEAVGFKPSKTRAVVVAVNNEAIVRDIVETWRAMSPKTKIFARAHNLKSANDLLSMGVKSATPEIIESSFMVGTDVLTGLGQSKAKITALVDNLRANNYANVKQPIDTK